MIAFVSHSARRFPLISASAAIIIWGLTGCAHVTHHVDGVAWTPPSPSKPWTSPKTSAEKRRGQEPTETQTKALEPVKKLTLAEAVDIALLNNPATRISWNNAKAAAAGYGAALGAMYPSAAVNGTAFESKGQSYQSGAGGYGASSDATITGRNASASLSLLLFNFGGRLASIEQSRQALLAADWTHNAVIQNVVLQTEEAFFNHVEAKALLEANRTSLAEAETGMNAAEERRRVGLSTNADVLQARTAYSEIKLAVLGSEGQVRVSGAALAAALGFMANEAFAYDPVSPELPAVPELESVNTLIERALSGRPDLQASRAFERESAAAVRKVRSNLLPSLSVTGSLGRTWMEDVPGFNDSRSGSLLLQVPLFSGFSRQFNLSAAKAEAASQKERTRAFEQSVTFDVFSSHSNFITAGERLKTVEDLVASAQQSEEVALGRYKEGVGSILDLLSTQKALAMARAEQINGRLGWFTAFARLSHDIGILGPRGDNPLPSQSISPEGQP
jgi:outer membrane protein